ncbi:MAG: hypothetical protein LBU22_13630 [Dysgonamonadaceae bacterium]|jgi:hypothetical protein|nr:hypothetical protein [Dysgonamonadaceae bacterium]
MLPLQTTRLQQDISIKANEAVFRAILKKQPAIKPNFKSTRVERKKPVTGKAYHSGKRLSITGKL